MSKVKVLVSEYSRRAAHELDDLRERWLMRRREAGELSEPKRDKLDFKFGDIEELNKMMQDNIARVRELSCLSVEHKKLKGKRTHEWYNKQRLLLTSELTYRERLHVYYKQAKTNLLPSSADRQFIDFLRNENRELRDYIFELADTYHIKDLPEFVTSLAGFRPLTEDEYLNSQNAEQLVG